MEIVCELIQRSGSTVGSGLELLLDYAFFNALITREPV